MFRAASAVMMNKLADALASGDTQRQQRQLVGITEVIVSAAGS